MSARTDTLLLHEDSFYEHFRPYRHPMACHDIWGGHGLETFGGDLALVRTIESDRIWTVVDGDDSSGDQWIVPGIRYVNRVCHLVTENPHRGLEVHFRCPHRPSTLTPLGLERQVNRLRRALSLSL